MPTEVLVMCAGCGRPQAARQGKCVVCGAVLPDAPLPATPKPEAPFLLAELGGGRTLTGVDRRLTYRADAAAPPIIIELGNLQAVTLGRRFLLEALGLTALALVLVLAFPSLRPVAAVLSGLGVLITVLWRRYVLVLKATDGGRTWWPLGTVRLGSERERRIGALWSTLARALPERGVAVQETPGAFGPRA